MSLSAVMPGLGPGMHDFFFAWEHVDGRDKPGHDDSGMVTRELERMR